MLVNRTGFLTANDFTLSNFSRSSSPMTVDSNPSEAQSLDSIERDHLQHALQQCAWNVSKAATLLGISRDKLRYRMAQHGLQRQHKLGG